MRVWPWHIAHRSAVLGNKGQNECSIICPRHCNEIEEVSEC